MGGFRSYGYRYQWRGMVPPAIKTLLIACAAVFALQTVLKLIPGGEAYGVFNRYLGLVPYAVLHGYIWQLGTYIFLHGSIWHLLFNMLFLWMFGRDLERTWGARKFYTYFFVCGIGAGVVNVVVKGVLAAYGIGSTIVPPTIGASGAIFGILLAMAILFPHQQVWIIPFPVTLPMRVYVLIMGAVEFYFTLETPGDGVSHICHLGGMLAGYIYLRRGSFLYNFRNYFSDWQRRRLKKKFDVYVRRHRDRPPDQPDNWVN
ncbi:MAG TPA: rhomboid family intramembrane serine protease [Candidatus Sulfotelmatobacter sp.]|nr:rhomboid family intramembrane serine protease [Candidatus Sulfotelmatobacter sp.]